MSHAAIETQEKTMVPPKYDECLRVAESRGNGTGVREETDEARERERKRKRERNWRGVFCSLQPPALRGPDPRSVFNYLQGR